MAFKAGSCPESLEPVSMLDNMARRDSADVLKVKDLEMGRLSWIIQVGPIKSMSP